MKKFTKNFLNERYSRPLRIFRSLALGLIALVWTHGFAVAQTCLQPSGTVTFIADDIDACYMGDNLYKVNISVMDFNNVDSLNLFLDYDEVYWTYQGFDILVDSVFSRTNSGAPGSGLVNVPLSVNNSGGQLNIHWTEKVTTGTINAVGEVPIVELTFSLNNFPNNNSFPYSNPLVWNTATSEVLVCGGGTTYVEWTDVDYTNGEVAVAGPEAALVTYTLDPTEENIACWNSPVEVTITSPVGDGAEYKINGTAWTTETTFNTVPGNQTIQYITADGCLSTVQSFEIEGPAPITFDVDKMDAGCSGELGTISIDAEGGTGDYTYWVVDEDEMDYVLTQIIIKDSDDPIFNDYKTSSSLISRAPGHYYVNVNDENDCGDLGGIEDEGSWYHLVIEDGGMLTSSITYDVETVTCPDGNDGAVSISMTSENYKDGFLVQYNGIDTLVIGSIGGEGEYHEATLEISDLEPGTTVFYISDSLCSITDTAVIKNRVAPTFYVEYTDAPCTASTGEIWVSSINDSTNLTPYINEGWTFTVQSADTLISGTAVGDTVEGLPSGYYRAWLVWSATCDSVAFNNVDGSGNTIPILDDGMINFIADITDETCFDYNDGKIGIDSVWRSCPNCNEGAVYQFMVTDTAGALVSAWQSVDSVISNLEPDDYIVYVRDSMKMDTVCTVSDIVTIDGPDSELTAVVDTVYSPTCVGGNDGWVRMYVSGGVAPYSYSVDQMPNWRDNPSFGLTEGQHLLRVMDANGCEWDTVIIVPELSPIMITASIDTIECADAQNPISVVIDTFTHYSDPTDYTYWYAEVGGNPVTNGISFRPEELAETLKPATLFGAGTYLVVVEDPNGCFSNVDTVKLEEVPELIVEVSKVEDATCYGTWSGQIRIDIESSNPNNHLVYAIANNSDVFVNPNAVINWIPIPMGDTVVFEELQEGEYWIQVQDTACSEKTNPQQVIVEGFDAIDIVTKNLKTDSVSCYGEADGVLTIPANAVKGGAPGGYDGLGGEGSTGNYLFTLVDIDADTIVGTEMQTSNVFNGLAAGDYKLFVFDTTDPDAEPAQCSPDSAVVTIKQPVELEIDLISEPVSCNGEEDGEINVTITGGTKPYSVTINGITGDDEYSLLLGSASTVDFQVFGGEYQIIVADANGCSVIDTIIVEEPDAWTIDISDSEAPSDCNVADGKIIVHATGGYAGEDVYYKLDDGYWQLDTMLSTTATYFPTVYTIYVANDTTGVNQCIDSTTISFEVINPFEFDVDVECVQCYGGDNGKVTISNMTGGSGKYQVQLVGGDNPVYDPTQESLWWPKKANGTNLYTDSIVFDTLTAGTYWIYVRDDAGFTLDKCCRPISFEMCEPDSLILESVTLVSNVACYGDSTGALSIQASGGIAPYQYAITKVTSGFEYVGVVPEDAVWYNDSIINGLPVGTYIGWVKDANECVTGCEINSEGLPIDDHRVVIQQAGAVTFADYEIDEPVCYGGLADVTLFDVTGGTGDSLTFKVTGKTYAGVDTTYIIGPIERDDDMVLEGLLASDTSGYVVTLATEFDCESEGDTIMVTQPDVYSVEAVIKTEGLCEGDVEVLISIETVGGEGASTYDIKKDNVLVRENSTIVNHVLQVGAVYEVIATDELGCSVSYTLDIPIPQPVTFTAENITCYGDTLASARINASGTPDRTFQVKYREIEANGSWVTYPGTFSASVELNQIFTYDSEEFTDSHYEIKVVDSEGCESVVDTLTFDEVQNELVILDIDQSETVGCETTIEVSAMGGSAPLTLYVNGEPQDEMTAVLANGSNVVMVMDDHGCFVTDTIDTHCVLTIAEVQSESESSAYVDDVVEISGTVSAVAVGGFYVQDENAAWSGIWVASDEEVEIGDGVTVVGIVDEVDDVTTITEAEVTVGTAALTVEAIEVLPEEVADEMYESVLVYVHGVRANAADSTGMWTAYTQDTITITVDTMMYTSEPVAGNFYDVTGIVNGMDSTYYVEPRMEEDVVDLTATPNKPEVGNTIEFKVYPNPFNDVIRIDNNDKLTRVVISNIAGQRVADIEYPSHEIRTGNLVSGVYLISLFTEDGIAKTERIVKR